MKIYDHFQHINLTNDQRQALKKLHAFLDSDEGVFILQGYAGSGKTTILKGLCEYLTEIKRNYSIYAPTGRAAKVIREVTGKEASTVHKGIYSYSDMEEVADGDSFYYYYKIRPNNDPFKRIYLIDEASMLSDAKSEGEFFRFGSGHLLSDLFTYTRINEAQIGSKIIFVGDPCQLPPIGDNKSRALDADFLRNRGFSVDVAEMKEVKRQTAQSGILQTATKIRKSVSAAYFSDFRILENGIDLFSLSFDIFLKKWQDLAASKIIIAYKNKTCLELNNRIRQIRYGDSSLPVQKSDIVILGGNNYSKGVFNGEFAVVNNVSAVPKTITVRFYPKRTNNHSNEKSAAKEVILSWRTIELIFPDKENNNKIVSGQMLENLLHGENVLTPDEMQALYIDFKNRHPNLKPKTDEFKDAIVKDEYFNCLLIKYGYAVTCHKAQGGEWNSVFTIWDHDHGERFNCYTDKQDKSGKTNEGFYRWAYTAITRASQKLYTINPPSFTSYSSMAIVDGLVVESINKLTGQQTSIEEIEIDNEMLELMRNFNISDHPLLIQDHFINVYNTLRKRYIEISGWKKNNLEIFYYFKREGDTAALKTWINNKNIFNGKFLQIPSATNNSNFCNEIEGHLKALPQIHVKRDTSELVLSKIEFEIEQEERFPFTLNLFEDIQDLTKSSGIVIDKIEHLQFKERYTFKRNEESIMMDFEYNNDGFFGRVMPVSKNCNSVRLLNEIKIMVRNLKDL